jgi:hypothetical protein
MRTRGSGFGGLWSTHRQQSGLLALLAFLGLGITTETWAINLEICGPLTKENTGQEFDDPRRVAEGISRYSVSTVKEQLPTQKQNADHYQELSERQPIYRGMYRNYRWSQCMLEARLSELNAQASTSVRPSSAEPARPDRQKVIASAGEVAHSCLTVVKSGLYGGFANSCTFAVNFKFCALNPRKGTWTEHLDCEKSAVLSLSSVAAKAVVTDHTHGAEKIAWFACKSPAHPSGETRFNSQKRRLEGYCVD